MSTQLPLQGRPSRIDGARRARTAGTARPARQVAEAVPPAAVQPGQPPVVVDVVVPVYNEERDLGPSVRRLRSFLDTSFPFLARITIADNASADGTWHLARQLADELPGVRAIHLPQKGRGRALRAAWTSSDAVVVAYMDVDLSTDLAALLPLVAPLIAGHSEIAIGSRLAPGAHVVRGPRREFISRSYNLILRSVLRVRFRDAQCGFKAVRADVARRLLPTVRDQAWFFDTELLVRAERAGLRIHEVPVDWVDDPDSRVHIRSTAIEDLKGVRRLLRDRIRGERLPTFGDLVPRAARRDEPTLGRQVRRFAAIGIVSTLSYVVLYSALRTGLPAELANAAALLITALGNTAANRRLTFAISGRAGLGRDHAAGLAAFGVALTITSGSIELLQLVAPSAGRLLELAVLVAANGLATVSRFVLLRTWIAGPRRTPLASVTTAERTLS